MDEAAAAEVDADVRVLLALEVEEQKIAAHTGASGEQQSEQAREDGFSRARVFTGARIVRLGNEVCSRLPLPRTPTETRP